jgi:hypothetical protein
MSPEPDRESAPGSGSDGTELDRALDALSHRYRRRILFALSARPTGRLGPISLDDLVTDGRDRHRTTGDAVLEERPVLAPVDADEGRSSTAVRVELSHVHLPKLADSGYVRWDADAGTVRRGPSFDRVEPIVRILIERWDELPMK